VVHKTHIIIGTSAAGLGAAYRLRMLDPNARIIAISYENEPPYNKCFIVDYLSNLRERDAVLTLTMQAARAKNIELVLGVWVLAIDTEQKCLSCSDGSSILFDTLFIATGSLPLVPSIIGSRGARGIFTFYHLADVDSMRAYMRDHSVRSAVVIGAGLTGLEAADGLRAQGIAVTVIERAPQLLPRIVDDTSSRMIATYMQKVGAVLCLGVSVVSVEQHNGAITGLSLSDNSYIKAELLVFAVGAQPGNAFAKTAGIALHNGYIRINSVMQTNIPGIFAGGDCAVLPQREAPSFTWPEAMQQGMCAAYSMVGESRPYRGGPAVISSAFFGVKFASCGLIAPTTGEYTIKTKEGDDFYHRYVYSDSILRGFVLVGNTQFLAHLRREVVAL
jgi:nitrite reductase (NADH) large subunit